MARRSAKPKQPLSASELLATESADDGMDENREIATETDGAEQARTGLAKATEPRFHIFVIDSGWNSVASKVLHENLDLIRDLNSDDHVFFVGRDASIALLRKYAWQIGRDPILSVHDMRPIHRHRVHHSHGFRMHLGILQDEKEVLSSLQMFARFLKMNRAVADVEAAVRKTLRQEGFSGAIQVIGGTASAHLAEGE